MVCSFRRSGAFDPETSAVRVETERAGPAATISFGAECDLCSDLPEPECVRYCPPLVLRRQEIHTGLLAGGGRA